MAFHYHILRSIPMLLITFNSAFAEVGVIQPACKKLLQSSSMIALQLVQSRKCEILQHNKAQAMCTYSVGETHLSYSFKRKENNKNEGDSFNSTVIIHTLDPKMKVTTVNYSNNSIGVSISWKKSFKSQCLADAANIYKDKVSWPILLYTIKYGHLLPLPKLEFSISQ